MFPSHLAFQAPWRVLDMHGARLEGGPHRRAHFALHTSKLCFLFHPSSLSHPTLLSINNETVCAPDAGCGSRFAGALHVREA